MFFLGKNIQFTPVPPARRQFIAIFFQENCQGFSKTLAAFEVNT
jgi:hypothetical protein